MGLYERLLEERAQEERRRGGGPLPPRRGSGSKVLDGRLGGTPKGRPPGYAADLATMRRHIIRGVRSPWAGMRLGNLKARYREEHAELAAEAWGQGRFCRGEGAWAGDSSFAAPGSPIGPITIPKELLLGVDKPF